MWQLLNLYSRDGFVCAEITTLQTFVYGVAERIVDSLGWLLIQVTGKYDEVGAGAGLKATCFRSLYVVRECKRKAALPPSLAPFKSHQNHGRKALL